MMNLKEIYIPRVKETAEFFELVRSGCNIRLVGHDNVGKTTFLRHIVEEKNMPEDIKNKYFVYCANYFFYKQKNEFYIFKRFLNLSYKLVKKDTANLDINEPTVFLDINKYEESIDRTVEYFGMLADHFTKNNHRKMLIVIDNIYRFAEDFALYPWARGIIEISEKVQNVQWIFLDNDNLKKSFAGNYANFFLKRFSPEELKYYLKSNFHDLSTVTLNDFIVQTGGIPYLVMELLENMANNGSYDDASYGQAIEKIINLGDQTVAKITSNFYQYDDLCRLINNLLRGGDNNPSKKVFGNSIYIDRTIYSNFEKYRNILYISGAFDIEMKNGKEYLFISSEIFRQILIKHINSPLKTFYREIDYKKEVEKHIKEFNNETDKSSALLKVSDTNCHFSAAFPHLFFRVIPPGAASYC